ncbi:MAG: hypothetical protein SFU83_19530 [Meiothermus sp.]|nr:hypothetical protein [Meiothermus sp.]
MNKLWIAFHGYGRVGKDTAGNAVIAAVPGMKRVAMGDYIKADTDAVLQEYTGISAWTDDPVGKEQIRGFLVQAGYHRYPKYWQQMTEKAQHEPLLVNTRIFRLEECQWWVDNGGVIFEIVRPNCGPKDPKEHEELLAVREAGLITAAVFNDGTVPEFERKITNLTRGLAAVKLGLTTTAEGVLV